MRLSKQIYINAFFTIATASFAFVINKSFVVHLGMDNLGIMKLFTQLVAYLNLAELGVATASTYALYRPIEENDDAAISRILSTVSFFYKKVAIFVLIVGTAVVFVLPLLLGQVIVEGEVYVIWILYVVNVALSYSYAKFVILYTANQEYGYVRLVQGVCVLFFNILRLVAIIYYKSFVAFVIFYLLENTVIYFIFRSRFIINYKQVTNVKERQLSIYRDMKNIFWHKIAALAVYNTDLILLSIFTSLSVVAIYSSHIMVVNMVAMLVGIVIPVLSPRIGKFIAKNKGNNRKIFLRWKCYNLVLFCIGLALSITTYNSFTPFMNIWMGPEFELSKFTVALIVMNLFFKLTRGITESFKSNYGFFDDIYVPVLECFVNLILSLLLVNIMGLNGVIIGTLVSNIIIVLILKPCLVFERCFCISWTKYIGLISWYILLSILSLLIFSLLDSSFEYNLPSLDWLHWCLNAMRNMLLATFSITVAFMFDKTFRVSIIEPSYSYGVRWFKSSTTS
ncbi:polysaccharide biosynthesis protein [Vibrio sp. dhg]|uniref:polysaccharide biosynthesis protein n=1 Tax=Vibrio sp. dhg TaxID=2163016 RepID=UPI000E477D42|nr:polysaccharide biosynthesis protein [Vibrio sp. dhg]AXT69681.1 polysaccharide biosynthesis protein [Vibrio sp. dhg]